jgi:hypothetical protein
MLNLYAKTTLASAPKLTKTSPLPSYGESSPAVLRLSPLVTDIMTLSPEPQTSSTRSSSRQSNRHREEYKEYQGESSSTLAVQEQNAESLLRCSRYMRMMADEMDPQAQ